MTSSVFSPLLRWYRVHGRTLPWRQTRDPYKILVSEIMLQQTQVERVKIFYQKWLRQFPNWQSLAAATNADVIHAWAGLGYNRRGLMLRDIAQAVVRDGVPSSEAAWQELKGIGPYTAAALAAFSLHERTMPVDTNIRRVLARLLLGKPFPEPALDEKLRLQAEPSLKTVRAHYDVPQAMFDLATSICKKEPDCAKCPLKSRCLAAPKFLSGRVRVPKAMIRKAKERKHMNKPHPDRIYRGRILAAVRQAPKGVPEKILGPLIDHNFQPADDNLWLSHMLQRLRSDQLIAKRGGRWVLA